MHATDAAEGSTIDHVTMRDRDLEGAETSDQRTEAIVAESHTAIRESR